MKGVEAKKIFCSHFQPCRAECQLTVVLLLNRLAKDLPLLLLLSNCIQRISASVD
jgi:hypothetical protein